MATRKKPQPMDEKKNKRAEIFKDVVDRILGGLKIIDVREKTHVYAVAVDRKAAERNQPVPIPCESCYCVSGYTYDSKNDCIWLQGVDHRDMGTVDFCVQVTMENTGSWRTYVPMSVSALERVFSSSQVRAVEDFRQKYPGPQYDIHFVQMISCR